jgi:hypothetical protein
LPPSAPLSPSAAGPAFAVDVASRSLDRSLITNAKTKRKVEVEVESHELGAIRRLRSLDDIMTDVLDSARSSDVDGFVVLTANRFALEHLAGEIAHTVNHCRRWTAQIDALANAVDAIELALAED